jgi:gas vesicle protein
MNNNRGFEFLAGLVMGGILGAATVLLMAPASGEETREQIRARSRELKSRGEALGYEAKVRVQKATKEGHNHVSDMQERTGLALEEQKARLVEAIDAGKQAASQRKDKLMNRSEADKAPEAIAQA